MGVVLALVNMQADEQRTMIEMFQVQNENLEASVRDILKKYEHKRDALLLIHRPSTYAAVALRKKSDIEQFLLGHPFHEIVETLLNKYGDHKIPASISELVLFVEVAGILAVLSALVR